MQHCRIRFIQHTLTGIIVLFTIAPVLAQSTNTNALSPYPQQHEEQSYTPKSESEPE